MRIYLQIMILTALIASGYIYAQPPFAEDCEDPENCIEMQVDFHPGPPDMDRPDLKDRNPPKLTQERIEKIMRSLEEKHPQFHKKILSLRENHPEVFERTLHKLRRFVRNDKKGPMDRQKLIDIFSDEIDFDLMVEKYMAEKDQKARKDIKAEMLKKMRATFDKKENMKLEIIKNIEKNLEEKRRIFEKRQAEKDKMIEEDLERILKHLESE
ncbi:MAG TPA: hypothetical protein PKW56_02170 [Clostridiales bacterium]|nr:hypothetical protein [Clostridiales bacterium]